MTRDYTKRPLTDTEKKQNLVFTFVAAFCRMYELQGDPNLYETEVELLQDLRKWWNQTLTPKQKHKIERCIRKYGSDDPGTPQHKEESQLVLMCTYGRMLQLRCNDKRSYSENEEWKRCEYEWALLPQELQFQVVGWVKGYFAHYDHPLMLEQI